MSLTSLLKQDRDFFKLDEVAEALTVSLSTARRMAHNGELDKVMIGGSLRIPRHSLVKYLPAEEA